jgi:pyruvate formate lyase activating enzyme
MTIGGLQKTTLIDFPGKLACTVFISGCNFFCPWCYSPELVLPERIKKQPKVSEKEFFDFLKSKQGLLEGVVICGGEPSLDNDLPEFIKRIKKLRYLVKLDTNGSNPEILKNLIDRKLIDYVAMDIKAPLNKYQASGINYQALENIEKSVEILKERKVDYEFRSTILPKIHSEEDVINMAKWIKGSKIYYLQQFRSEKTLDTKYEKYKHFSQEQLKEIQKECNKYVLTKLR